jgi:hypothetical protein
VKKGSIEVEDRFSGVRRRLAAAVVVDAGHRLADESVYRALASGAPPSVERAVARCGDCVAPRTLLEAVLEGRRAALAIDGLGRLSDGVPMAP